MNIYISKYTAIGGLAILVLGVALGFFVRPLISPARDAAQTTNTEPANLPTSAAQADSNSGDEGAGNDAGSTQKTPALVELTPSSSPAPTEASSQSQELMDYAISQTRHFRGDANAPITMIEFSDFL